MKKIIQWLDKVFNANITIKETVYNDRIIYKPLTEYQSGDLKVEGNLIVDGAIEATQDIIAYKLKEN